MGLMFAFIYHKTERIIVPIAAHFFANFFSLLSETIMSLMPTGMIVAGDAIVGGLVFIIGSLLTVISVVYLWNYECDYK